MTIQATTATYVAYQHPGLFLSEESAKQVDARNPQQQANDAPDTAFAFFYFDVVTTIVNVGDELVETSSGRRNITGMYYIDAEVMTADQVAAMPNDHSILLRTMRANRWETVLHCRTGNFQPFDAEKHELVTTS